MDKKSLITIGSAVGAGAISKGVTGMVDMNRTTKIAVSFVLCGLATYGATTVKPTQNALQGAYTGVAIAQAFETLKAIADTDAIKSKLNSDTKLGQFGQKALGLSGVAGGLEGYFDELGNYHDEGLGGYIPVEGGFVPYESLNAYNELDALKGYNELDGGLGFANEEEYQDESLGFANEEEYQDESLGYAEEDNSEIWE